MNPAEDGGTIGSWAGVVATAPNFTYYVDDANGNAMVGTPATGVVPAYNRPTAQITNSGTTGILRFIDGSVVLTIVDEQTDVAYLANVFAPL